MALLVSYRVRYIAQADHKVANILNFTSSSHDSNVLLCCCWCYKKNIPICRVQLHSHDASLFKYLFSHFLSFFSLFISRSLDIWNAQIIIFLHTFSWSCWWWCEIAFAFIYFHLKKKLTVLEFESKEKILMVNGKKKALIATSELKFNQTHSHSLDKVANLIWKTFLRVQFVLSLIVCRDILL